jgi:hypothetical protein
MANSLEAKIVVLGSQGVGKTSLVHRYVKSVYLPPSTQSTIGASFLTKRVVDIDTSTVVRLQIWDTAGQERFRSISKLYYRGMSFNMHPLITPQLAPSGPACLFVSSLHVLLSTTCYQPSSRCPGLNPPRHHPNSNLPRSQLDSKRTYSATLQHRASQTNMDPRQVRMLPCYAMTSPTHSHSKKWVAGYRSSRRT